MDSLYFLGDAGRDQSNDQTDKQSNDKTTKLFNHAYGRKLIRYLSGGGLAAFTRSAEEERADAKQERFLFVAAIFGIAWLVFWIF